MDFTRFSKTLVTVVALAALLAASYAAEPLTPVAPGADLDLVDATVNYVDDLELLVFEQSVAGSLSAARVAARGQMDGAPVLAYVFPTSLEPADVGFGGVEGVVALAVTVHPDFDDTPLWDENNNGAYDDDGLAFHSHWVVLNPDDRVAGGLSVVEFEAGDTAVRLPPTNPGMPMFMDSPGYSVVVQDGVLKVLVPAQRVNHRTNFRFDAVTAYLQVNTSDADLPLLGVYQVYEVLSGDLSLPFEVTQP